MGENNKLEPKKVEKVDLTPKQMFLEPPPGHVMLVALDKDGNEIDEPFFQTERMYKKYYSDEKKYTLKKKHNSITK